MMNLEKSIAERILYFLKKENITLAHLALLAEMPYSTLYSVVTLKTKDVSVLTIKKICDALEMPLKDFFDDPSFSYHPEND